MSGLINDVRSRSGILGIHSANRPRFLAQGSPTIHNSNYTKNYANVFWNPDGSYVNSTGVFTCKTAGLYYFGTAQYKQSGTISEGDWSGMQFQVAGGGSAIDLAGFSPAHNTGQTSSTGTTFYPMKVDETMRAWTSFAVQASTPRNYFFGVWISAL